MCAYYDYLFCFIQSHIDRLEQEIDNIAEDELGFNMHMARRGAKISPDRWNSIYGRMDALRMQRDQWQFLKEKLHYIACIGNTQVPPTFCLHYLESKTIAELASAERYEDCTFIQQFVESQRLQLESFKNAEGKYMIYKFYDEINS